MRRYKDVEKAEQRGYMLGSKCVKDGCSGAAVLCSTHSDEAYERGAAEERRRIAGGVEKFDFRWDFGYGRFSDYSLDEIKKTVLSIIHDNK